MGLASFIFHLDQDLPSDLKVLSNPYFELPTIIQDRQGRVVDELFLERRVLIQYEQIPFHLLQALLASEDTHFFSHRGIDPPRMIKAAWVNLRQGRLAQGASTITQQIAKLFLLSSEKKWVRKFKEIILAIRIERQFSKEEILSLYFNKVFLGNALGVEAAAQGYFGKHTNDLNLSESAMLVGLLPAPSLFNPLVNQEQAKRRRDWVISRMLSEGFIDQATAKKTLVEPLKLVSQIDPLAAASAPYVQFARESMIQKFGAEAVFKGGFTVQLGLEGALQLQLQQRLITQFKHYHQQYPLEQFNHWLKWILQADFQQKPLQLLSTAVSVKLGDLVQGKLIASTPSALTFAFPAGQAQINIPSVQLKGTEEDVWQLDLKGRINAGLRELKFGQLAQFRLSDWNEASSTFIAEPWQAAEDWHYTFLVSENRTGEIVAYLTDAASLKEPSANLISPVIASKHLLIPFIYLAAVIKGHPLGESWPLQMRDNATQPAAGSPQSVAQSSPPVIRPMSLAEGLMTDYLPQAEQWLKWLGEDAFLSSFEPLLSETQSAYAYNESFATVQLPLQQWLSAYRSLGNLGKTQDNRFVLNVRNRQGEVVEDNRQKGGLDITANMEKVNFQAQHVYPLVYRLSQAQRNSPPHAVSGSTADTAFHLPERVILGDLTEKPAQFIGVGLLPQYTAILLLEKSRQDGVLNPSTKAYGKETLAILMEVLGEHVQRESWPIPENLVFARWHRQGRPASVCDHPADIHYEVLPQEFLTQLQQEVELCPSAQEIKN